MWLILWYTSHWRCYRPPNLCINQLVCVFVCLSVCARHACVCKAVHALLSHLLQVPLWVGFSLHATHSFCHALCTVPLHIFIYYCVFQDQNEWQIGSSEINIAAEVGVSWGRQTGTVSERNRSYQGRFCSCLSEAPQVIKWMSSEKASLAHRDRERERERGRMEFIRNLLLRSASSFSTLLFPTTLCSLFFSYLELNAALISLCTYKVRYYGIYLQYLQANARGIQQTNALTRPLF